MIDWYQLYLNHPGGSIIEKTIREVCYWKFLVTQAEMFGKMCKTYQKFKKRQTLYAHLSPKNIEELKPGDTVHVDLIGPYNKSIIQHQSGSTFILNNASLTCMAMIYPATGWFEILEIPKFDLK